MHLPAGRWLHPAGGTRDPSTGSGGRSFPQIAHHSTTTEPSSPHPRRVTRLQRRIHQLGGLAATHELRDAGFGRETLRLATRTGEIRRIRQGWYILPDTPAGIADCARVGGRASCLTVASASGLWLVEPPSRVHVTVRPNACQLRHPRDYRVRDAQPGAVVHWTGSDVPCVRLAVGIPEAVREMAGCVGAEAAFIAWESALAAGVATRADVRRVCEGLPAALVVALSRARGLSGSITEAAFVFRADVFGVRVRQQVQIGADRVDVLLGDRLVVELDSREFHERERDYARDARLGVRGYRVLRFSYHQVMREWPAVEAAVLAAVARGDAA